VRGSKALQGWRCPSSACRHLLPVKNGEKSACASVAFVTSCVDA
jgi:hypothetical protein